MFSNCDGYLIFHSLTARNQALEMLRSGHYVQQKGTTHFWKSENNDLNNDDIAVSGDTLTITIPNTLYLRFEPTLLDIVDIAASGEISVLDNDNLSLWVWKNGTQKALADQQDILAYLHKQPNAFVNNDEDMIKASFRLDEEEFEKLYLDNSKTAVIWETLETAAEHLLNEIA